MILQGFSPLVSGRIFLFTMQMGKTIIVIYDKISSSCMVINFYAYYFLMHIFLYRAFEHVEITIFFISLTSKKE